MVERGRRPVACSMTQGAVPRERRSLVIRIDRAVIQRSMTGCTIRWSPREPVSRVTLHASCRQMGSHQRKSRVFCMIESGRKVRVLPLIQRVTTLAPCAKTGCLVVNRSRRSVLRCVTGDARGAQAGKSPARRPVVTGLAGRRRMSACQGKPVQVLPNRIDLNAPALHRMTPFARRTKLPPVNVRVT